MTLQCLLLLVLMVVPLPSRANMILMLWIVYLMCFVVWIFTLMFSVAPLVKLMLCFLLWLGALLCHGEIKGFHWKICRCIVVLFNLFKTKQNNNSNRTLGRNLTFHLKHFCCHLLINIMIFLFSWIWENVGMYKYVTFIHVLHIRLFNTYMLDASWNFVYNK